MEINFKLLGGAFLLLSILAHPVLAAGHHDQRLRFPRLERRAAPGDAPVEVLRRLLQAEASLTFEATQTTTVSRGGLDISSEQRVLRDGARAIRIDYTRPARLAGESIVDNGQSYWHYRPKDNTLETGPSRIQRLRKKIQGLIAQTRRGELTVAAEGQDFIAGRPCSIVDVRPSSGQPGPWRRLWVDAATGAQLRIDQYDADGQRRSSSFYTAIAFNPAIPPDAFSAPGAGRNPRVRPLGDDKPFKTVADAEAKAGFSARLPQYLPSGFRFQSASVSEFRRRPIIALRYNNGISVISLFQTVDDSGDAGPKFGGKRTDAVTRTQAGRKLVLVGNLPATELNQMIESVR